MKRLLSCLILSLLLVGCASEATTPTSNINAANTDFASLVATATPTRTATGGMAIAASPTPTHTPSTNTQSNTVPISYQPANNNPQPQPKSSGSSTSASQPVTHQSAPAPTPIPTKVAPKPTPTPTPPAKPTPMPDGAPGNPWGYDFEPGTAITAPPAEFCNYFSCIANFANGKGYVMECKDSMYSKSGGVSGSCSGHKGNNRELYSH